MFVLLLLEEVVELVLYDLFDDFEFMINMRQCDAAILGKVKTNESYRTHSSI